MNSNVVEQVGQQVSDGLSGFAGSTADVVASAFLAAVSIGAVIFLAWRVWRTFVRLSLQNPGDIGWD